MRLELARIIKPSNSSQIRVQEEKASIIITEVGTRVGLDYEQMATLLSAAQDRLGQSIKKGVKPDQISFYRSLETDLDPTDSYKFRKGLDEYRKELRSSVKFKLINSLKASKPTPEAAGLITGVTIANIASIIEPTLAANFGGWITLALAMGISGVYNSIRSNNRRLPDF